VDSGQPGQHMYDVTCVLFQDCVAFIVMRLQHSSDATAVSERPGNVDAVFAGRHRSGRQHDGPRGRMVEGCCRRLCIHDRKQSHSAHCTLDLMLMFKSAGRRLLLQIPSFRFLADVLFSLSCFDRHDWKIF